MENAAPPQAPVPQNADQTSTLMSSSYLKIGTVAILLAVIGGIAWYLYAPSPKSVATSPVSAVMKKVTIGYTQWPGYIAFFVARDKGYFASEGLDMELRGYPSLNDAAL